MPAQEHFFTGRVAAMAAASGVLLVVGYRAATESDGGGPESRRASRPASPRVVAWAASAKGGSTDPIAGAAPGGSSAPAAGGSGDLPVRFYMYEGDAFEPDLCDPDAAARELPRGGYWCMGSEWVAQAQRHPWRTADPSLAEVFVVPFDLCASHASRRACRGKGHVQRLEGAAAALVASPWFQRRGGRDHVWVLAHNALPAALAGKRRWGPGRGRGATFFNEPRSRVIENVTVGRYLSYHLTLRDTTRVGFSPRQHDWLREEERWGCTVVLPVVTPRSLALDPAEATFERWERRGVFLHFRGNGGFGGGCFMKSGEQARAKAVELGSRGDLEWPGRVVLTNAHAPTVEEYHAEILNAKYCLVFACDDPQTSRFFEAVAAGCVPVVVNDAWRVAVAPFSNRVNYDSFSVTVPEAVWTGDPAAAAHLIYNRPAGERRRRFEALVRARRQLLWRHNDSNVATNVLLGARDCVAPE